MARIRGVHLRKPPRGPSAYTSKEAALAASPTMLVADAAFPKGRLESVKNAAFRQNSGHRGEWSPEHFFSIWEYDQRLVLRIRPDDSSVEVIGFVNDGEVTGDDGNPLGSLDDLLAKDPDIETGGWVLLIGMQPHVPEGWGKVVSAPGSRKKT